MKHPNGLKHGDNPHGIGLCTAAIVSVNMMLCMSHQGVLRLFKVWPPDRDARFENIRCNGAFLASSELKGGRVRFVKIHREAGRDCSVENPWPGCRVRLHRNNESGASLSGAHLTFTTDKGETIDLYPE